MQTLQSQPPFNQQPMGPQGPPQPQGQPQGQPQMQPPPPNPERAKPKFMAIMDAVGRTERPLIFDRKRPQQQPVQGFAFGGMPPRVIGGMPPRVIGIDPLEEIDPLGEIGLTGGIGDIGIPRTENPIARNPLARYRQPDVTKAGIGFGSGAFQDPTLDQGATGVNLLNPYISPYSSDGFSGDVGSVGEVGRVNYLQSPWIRDVRGPIPQSIKDFGMNKAQQGLGYVGGKVYDAGKTAYDAVSDYMGSQVNAVESPTFASPLDYSAAEHTDFGADESTSSQEDINKLLAEVYNPGDDFTTQSEIDALLATAYKDPYQTDYTKFFEGEDYEMSVPSNVIGAGIAGLKRYIMTGDEREALETVGSTYGLEVGKDLASPAIFEALGGDIFDVAAMSDFNVGIANPLLAVGTTALQGGNAGDMFGSGVTSLMGGLLGTAGIPGFGIALSLLQAREQLQLQENFSRLGEHAMGAVGLYKKPNTVSYEHLAHQDTNALLSNARALLGDKFVEPDDAMMARFTEAGNDRTSQDSRLTAAKEMTPYINEQLRNEYGTYNPVEAENVKAERDRVAQNRQLAMSRPGNDEAVAQVARDQAQMMAQSENDRVVAAAQAEADIARQRVAAARTREEYDQAQAEVRAAFGRSTEAHKASDLTQARSMLQNKMGNQFSQVEDRNINELAEEIRRQREGGGNNPMDYINDLMYMDYS